MKISLHPFIQQISDYLYYIKGTVLSNGDKMAYSPFPQRKKVIHSFHQRA